MVGKEKIEVGKAYMGLGLYVLIVPPRLVQDHHVGLMFIEKPTTSARELG